VHAIPLSISAEPRWGPRRDGERVISEIQIGRVGASSNQPKRKARDRYDHVLRARSLACVVVAYRDRCSILALVRLRRGLVGFGCGGLGAIDSLLPPAERRTWAFGIACQRPR